ncbi:helix-turn-helix domain-containing protein [Thermogutta sp.]|uniref:helix-turn-helix domain-containing protein n=1 Tax=Thermogutta sp. TaxID=1962930 RepID=UPI0032205554
MTEPIELYTAPMAAKRLRISLSRVYQLARRRGLGRRLGRYWIFTESEVEAMRIRGRPGRPRKREKPE